LDHGHKKLVGLADDINTAAIPIQDVVLVQKVVYTAKNQQISYIRHNNADTHSFAGT
jgi:hypothetical protein